jgi:serine/threonine protein kinase/WD40 repeat protein
MSEGSEHSAAATFDMVAEKFVRELREGRQPSLIEYKQEWPHLADEIDELFPMLQELETHPETSAGSSADRPSTAGIPSKLGEYEIVREIGRGGMGIVYEARHHIMQRRVALKVLPRSLSRQKNCLERFMREARAAGMLHHTNIVPVFEVGDADGVYFYAMQYIHGQNLDVVIDELRRISGSRHGQPPSPAPGDPATAAMTLWQGRADGSVTGKESPRDVVPDGPAEVPQREAGRPRATFPASESSEWYRVGDAGDSFFRRVARVGIQVAEALDFAHEHGLLHRDIKPSNLILDTNGVVWVTDFGLAKNDGENLTHTGDIVGTLRYMAPERFRDRADRRSDLYSLGLTLYELCTLEQAFDGADRAALIHQVLNHTPASLRRIRPEIPRDLETVIAKAIAREPQSRYQTAEQMAADLRRFVAGKPVLARRVSPAERLWRWSRRHPARAALVLSLLLLLAISLYFGYQQGRYSRQLSAENRRVRRAETETRAALEEARRAEAEARESERQATQARLSSRSHLFWSSYRLGSALRTTGTPGQRTAALQSLQTAWQTIPELGLPDAPRRRRQLAVRAHVISALAVWDVAETGSWPVDDMWNALLATDFAGQRYARTAGDGTIEIRDLQSAQPQARIQAPNRQPAWITTFSPRGDRLASKHHAEFRNREAFLYLWNIDEQKLLLQLPASGGRLQFAFSADNSKMAVAEQDGLAVYATHDGSLLQRIHLGFEPLSPRFAREDRQVVFIADPVHKIRFLSLKDQQVVHELTCSFDVNVLEWNDEFRQLVAAGDRLLAIWPAGDLQADPYEVLAHAASVRRVILRPQNDLLVTYGWDNTTRAFDMVTRRQVLQINGCQPVFCGFSTDGRLAFVDQQGRSGIWQFSRPELHTVLGVAAIAGTQQAHFHPGNSRILGCLGPQGIEFWNHARNRKIGEVACDDVVDWSFDTQGEYVYACGPRGVERWSLTFDGQGHGQLTASGRETICHDSIQHLQLDTAGLYGISCAGKRARIVDLQTQDVLQLDDHPRVSDVRISPCQRYAISGTWKGNGLKVWDAKGGQLLQDLDPDWASAKFAFSPDGRRLAAVDHQQRWIWDVESWKPQVRRQRDEVDGSVGGLAWSHDNQLLAARYNLNQPQLFLASTGETVAAFEPPVPLLVSQLEFSGDDRFLAVASNNGVQVWNIAGIRDELNEMGMDW